MSQLHNRIHREFLWIYRDPPEKFKVLNSLSKKLRNTCEICSIFEIFLRKMDILAKNVDIFEKWIHFLILCIVLKVKLRPPPLLGARDSLFVAGASPFRKNPVTATEN